ncbi:MAG: hypothetical protein E7361_02590, partial [Clostridiales bacterium]|nr:hypothetical protein [Clostridiales bacterium]
MINVGVIFGGKACEHDISIITALQLINNVDLDRYNVVPVYITKEGDWYYSKDFNTVENVLKYRSIAKPCSIMPNSNCLYCKTMFGYKPFIKIDVIFIAMHGMNGEDGMVRAVCDMAGIVCVNSHVLPSAIAMNKSVFKNYILGVGGVDQIKSMTYNSECNMEDFIDDVSKGVLNFPLILKPARLGSSIGISVANSVDELREKLIYSSRFDNTILIEEKLTNIKEYNIAVY